ncbi:hypothetical protein DF021_33835 [Burkholderia stagnalis]|uniref:hypothetical protein n=2 Tax=Burkholderia stagnalis TaxID=1503054 RepID=UPI000F5AD1B3|nr:hypothetical protein [Burkholderia stagnalis]RQQ60024.1 hypothetical protein DF139_33375 [Burkholderia stagnalis]RQR01819.1 hypothetical protein DF021_33835 [Burkholderia stagnalis]
MTDKINPSATDLKGKFQAGATPTQDDYAALIELADVGRKAVGAPDADATQLKPGTQGDGLTLDSGTKKLMVKHADGSVVVDGNGIKVGRGPGIKPDGPVAIQLKHDGDTNVSGLATAGGLCVVPGTGLSLSGTGLNLNLLPNGAGGLSLSTSASTSVLVVKPDTARGVDVDPAKGLYVKTDNATITVDEKTGALKLFDPGLKNTLSTTLDAACSAVLNYTETDTQGEPTQKVKDAWKTDTPLATKLYGTFSTALTAANATTTGQLKGWAETLRGNIVTAADTAYANGKDSLIYDGNTFKPSGTPAGLIAATQKYFIDALNAPGNADKIDSDTYTRPSGTATPLATAVRVRYADGYRAAVTRFAAALNTVAGGNAKAEDFSPLGDKTKDCTTALGETLSNTIQSTLNAATAAHWPEAAPASVTTQVGKDVFKALKTAHAEGYTPAGTIKDLCSAAYVSCVGSIDATLDAEAQAIAVRAAGRAPSVADRDYLDLVSYYTQHAAAKARSDAESAAREANARAVAHAPVEYFFELAGIKGAPGETLSSDNVRDWDIRTPATIGQRADVDTQFLTMFSGSEMVFLFVTAPLSGRKVGSIPDQELAKYNGILSVVVSWDGLSIQEEHDGPSSGWSWATAFPHVVRYHVEVGDIPVSHLGAAQAEGEVLFARVVAVSDGTGPRTRYTFDPRRLTSHKFSRYIGLRFSPKVGVADVSYIFRPRPSEK